MASELLPHGRRNQWKQDCLVLPRLQYNEDAETVDLAKVVNLEAAQSSFDDNLQPANYSPTRRSLPRYIPLDFRFLRLAGFYLSEGHVDVQSRGQNLCFSFSKTETEYANDVVDLIYSLFGLEAKIREKETALSVQVGSQLLGEFFSRFLGNGASNKRIPKTILSLSPEKQYHLLKSYIQGDGYLDNKRISMTTVSESLAYDLRTMLFKMGIIHDLSKRRIVDGGTIKGRLIKSNFAPYIISLTGPSARKVSDVCGFGIERTFVQSQLAGINDEYVFVPLKA